MTGKRALEIKRARGKERDAKHQRLEGEVIEISSDDSDAEGFVRVPVCGDKLELFRVFNAFQHSRDYGIYVCEKFRDPRFENIDSYFHEVEDCAIGISDLCRCIGRIKEPLEEKARAQVARFAETLENLARRTRAALDSSVYSDQ
jgi:hypothetical protein